MLTTCHCPHSHAALLCAVQQSITVACLLGLRQQPAECPCWDRQTGGHRAVTWTLLCILCGHCQQLRHVTAWSLVGKESDLLACLHLDKKLTFELGIWLGDFTCPPVGSI